VPAVVIQNLEKRFGSFRAVDDLSLEAPEGKILTLLGPSGCGKSTTLRCLAGLERPDAGEIRFNGEVVFSKAQGIFVPPERRQIGMVFQSYAIWPHMTVFENVAYPLRVRRAPRDAIERQVREALRLVGLEGLAQRPAPHLSGGQQQRVALARALVYEPKILLLDEPLSNLDAKVREQVREEVKDLQRQLGITTLYVTHDQLEAISLSDEVVIMNAGKIVERGNPRDLYLRPRAKFTCDFLGSVGYIPGRVARQSAAGVWVETASGTLFVNNVPPIRDGASVLVGIRAEHAVLSRRRPGGEENILEGQVKTALFEGQTVRCRIAVGEHMLPVSIPEMVEPGETVYLVLPPHRCLLIPAQ
jgi:iron(III) transport system ATP-binding protein